MQALALDQITSLVPSHRRYRTQILIAIGVLGFACRVALAYWSVGTNDIVGWRGFASQIGLHGLWYEYAHDRVFNHPPLMGWFAWMILLLSDFTQVRFPVLFKLPMIAVDALTGLLLLHAARRRHGSEAGALVFALYGLSPISILISAHHGNTDCLCAMFIVLAAVLAGETNSRFAAGAALGAAINVKLIPILCIPALLATGPRTLRAWGLSLAGLSLGVLPFIPVLVQVGPEFYRNAIAYNSVMDNWGLMHVLRVWTTHPRLASVATAATEAYRSMGRYVVIGAIVLISAVVWLNRRLNVYELTALSLSIFLVLAPGFGVQYLVYVSPLLFLVSPAFGIAYSCLAGLFVGLVYLCFWNGKVPIDTQFTTYFPAPTHPFGVLTWGLLLTFVGAGVAKTFRGDFAWAARARVELARVFLSDAQPWHVRHDAEHGAAAPLAQEAQPQLEQRDVAAELVGRGCQDEAALPGLEQHESPEQQDEHAPAIDVAHQ